MEFAGSLVLMGLHPIASPIERLIYRWPLRHGAAGFLFAGAASKGASMRGNLVEAPWRTLSAYPEPTSFR